MELLIQLLKLMEGGDRQLMLDTFLSKCLMLEEKLLKHLIIFNKFIIFFSILYYLFYVLSPNPEQKVNSIERLYFTFIFWPFLYFFQYLFIICSGLNRVKFLLNKIDCSIQIFLLIFISMDLIDQTFFSEDIKWIIHLRVTEKMCYRQIQTS